MKFLKSFLFGISKWTKIIIDYFEVLFFDVRPCLKGESTRRNVYPVGGLPLGLARALAFFKSGKVIAFIFLCFSHFSAAAQSDVRERVYVEVNTDLLLSGETFYFSVFNVSDQTGRLASLSQLMYVELIGESGPAFQKKIRLEQGRGEGSFFVNSLLPTGRYQLIAYTRWMKNFDDRFQMPIVIINPYETYTPSKIASDKPNLELYLPNDRLLANKENEFGYCLTNAKGERLNYAGKVVDEAGEKVSDFESQNQGCGIILLEVKADEKYKIVVEDDQGVFHFYDLPATTNEPLSNNEISPNRVEKVASISSLSTRYSEREQVELPVDLPVGNYTISVRRKEDRLQKNQIFAVHNKWLSQLEAPYQNTFASPIPHDNINLLKRANRYAQEKELPSTVEYLPEARNELRKGTARTEAGQPVANQTLIFSIPGKSYQIRSARTDSMGNFRFHFKSCNYNTPAFITPIGSEQQLNCELEPVFYGKAFDFDFRLPLLDSLDIAALAKRSIHSQISNAYFVKKEQVEMPYPGWTPQITKYEASYVLDDYNRFPAFKEYFVEYILGARIRKKEIFVGIYGSRSDFKQSQLILFDGIPVDAGKILEYNPYNIEKVSIVNNRFFLGDSFFDGLMSIETYDGKYEGYTPELAQRFDLVGAPPTPEIYDCNVITPLDTTKPDRRLQLLWKPSVESDGTPKTIRFSTSDVQGTYQIRINGFTDEGLAISRVGEFEVE